MTRDDVIRMAEESGGFQFNFAPAHWDNGDFAMAYENLERFAALVAAAEREECATLAEMVGSCDANMAKAWRNGCTDVAAAIRARGEK